MKKEAEPIAMRKHDVTNLRPDYAKKKKKEKNKTF